MVFDPGSARLFDQDSGGSRVAKFDPSTAAPDKQNTSLLQDLGTDVKRGVQQLPGVATGLADVVLGGVTGKRIAGPAADRLGEITGFQPGKWAEQAEREYSPQRRRAVEEIDKAWEQGDGWDVAGAYARNPGRVLGLAAESAPMMVAGGLAGRAALTGARAAGLLSTPAAGAAGITQAARQAAAAAAGGEGAMIAGATMDEIDDSVDARRAAVASLGAGVLGGGIGYAGGRLAQRAGIIDPDVMIAGGAGGMSRPAPGLVRRMLGGALTEGAFEELPQSIQEQMWQNWAEGKPIMEGVPRAAVEGALAGGVMGAGANIPRSRRREEEPAQGGPQIAGFLPAPANTGTPRDQIIRAEVERANEVAAAEARVADIQRQRAEYEAQQAGINPADGPVSRAAVESLKALPAPPNTGTPSEAMLLAQVERENAAMEAERRTQQLYRERDAVDRSRPRQLMPFNKEGAQRVAQRWEREQGTPFAVIPHPTAEGRFAVVHQDEADAMNAPPVDPVELAVRAKKGPATMIANKMRAEYPGARIEVEERGGRWVVVDRTDDPFSESPAGAMRATMARLAGLRELAAEAGWQEQGGRLLRNGEMGEVTGRTNWVPTAQWFAGKPDGVTDNDMRSAVAKIESGNWNLTQAEQQGLDYMLATLADFDRQEGEAQNAEAARLAELDAEAEAVAALVNEDVADAIRERVAVENEDATQEDYLRVLVRALNEAVTQTRGDRAPQEAVAAGAREGDADGGREDRGPQAAADEGAVAQAPQFDAATAQPDPEGAPDGRTADVGTDAAVAAPSGAQEGDDVGRGVGDVAQQPDVPAASAVQPAAAEPVPGGEPAVAAGGGDARAAVAAEEFIPAPDGSLDYGEITPEMGAAMRRQAGPIRLQRGVQNDDGTGYGLAHIQARHGREIASAGFESVESFVSEAVRSIDAVWKPSGTAQVVAVQAGKRGKVVFLELQPARDEAGDFYRVNSAFPAAENYAERKQRREGWERLWSRYPVPADASGAPGFVDQPPNAGEAAPTVSPQSDNTLPQPATPGNRDATSGQERITDVGEKIGGARKDTAGPSVAARGRRAATVSDERPAWARRFEISQVVSGSHLVRNEGKWMIHDARAKNAFGHARRVAGPFDSREEAEAMLPIAAVALKHRAVGVGRGDESRYEIWRDVTDRKRVKVVDKSFATRDEAMAYMAEHAVEIIETNTTFGEADLPVPKNKQRIGAARRDGNVSGEDFKKTFGFRGVEFGNWNNQAERQEVMNEAYDGLLDLAEVMDVPPAAISLGGDLALAFGARGHGLNGGRAHYERDKAVINLTKMNGAGALAHEWFHALDHYFGRQDGKASSQWQTDADGTRSLPATGPSGDFVSSGFSISTQSGVRPEVRGAYDALMETIFRKSEQYVEDTARAEEFVGRTKADVQSSVDSIRRELAAQKDPTYWKRNNKPAPAELLAEFDTLAQQIVEGFALETNLRSIKGSKARYGSYRDTNDTLERISEIMKKVRGRSGFTSEHSGPLDALRNSMVRYRQRLKMLSEAQSGSEKTKKVPTEFAMDAKNLDQGRGTDYWTTPHEMAARAFQGYVEDKIAAGGGRSPFLNYGPASAAIFTPWGWKRPFPAGKEREAINAALDKLVDTIQTRETEGGVEMFRRGAVEQDMRPGEMLELLRGESGKSLTAADLKASVADSVPGLEKHVDAMLERGRRGEKGGVVIVDGTDAASIEREYRRVTGRPLSSALRVVAESRSQAPLAFYQPQTGVTFLIGPMLNRDTAASVLLHEVYHSQQSSRLDAAALRMIEGRANAPARERELLDRVAARMASVGESGNRGEAAAYIIEEAVRAGQIMGAQVADSKFADWVEANISKRVANLIRGFVLAVRAWARRHGVTLGPITVDDLVGYAMAGVERAARGDVQTSRGGKPSAPAGSGEQFSRASTVAQTVGAAIDAGRRAVRPKAEPKASDTFSDLNDAQRAFLNKVGTPGGMQRTSDWARAQMERAGTRIRQGLVDRFAALKELDERAIGKDFIEGAITDSSWVLARMSSAASGALSAMMNAGRIRYDARQRVVAMQDGELSGGLTKTLQEIGTPAEVERFFAWMAANRAEKLMAEGREHLFTPDEIAAGKNMNAGKTDDGRARVMVYAKAHREFQQYRDDVLAIAEATGVISAENRAMWKDEFYVPFYRVMAEEEAAGGPRGAKGLSRQEAYKRLKGGRENLNDLLENTLMNFHHLLSAGLKNQAAAQAIRNAEKVGIARPVKESARDPKNSTFVLENGQRRFYEIDDPLVFESLTVLSDPGLNNFAVRSMSAFKRIFTNMTTVTPQFIVANTLRDLMQATATTPTSKNVFRNLYQGVRAFRDPKTNAEMLASGGAFSFGHIYGVDVDEIRASLPRALRGAGVVSDMKMVPRILRQGWQRWNDVANTSENTARAATFVQNVEQRGALYAAYQARDIMDFSAHGAWPAIRFLIRVVPFLNARLQGLDKIYRSGVKPAVLTAMGKGTAADKQAAARFAAVTGALTLATVALYMANADDDEYQKLEDWQKDTYWFFRIGDNAFFLPKPFEVGAIATVAERLAEQMLDDKATGDLFRERMQAMLMETFSFSPVPQMFQPTLDIYSNKDAFTGRPIESAGMERLSIGMRARETTTAPARALSAASRVFGDESPVALSPVQADHLIGGYLGSVGAHAAGIMDTVFRAASGQDSPDRHWYENQPMRRFYRDLGLPAPYTRYSTLFYDGLREANRVYADVQELQKLGRQSEAMELMAEKRNVLGLRQALNAQQRRLTEINNQLKVVQRSDRDGSWKRREMDRLNAMKGQITEILGKRIEAVRAAG